MTCPRCSAELEDSAHFCGVCGHRLESKAAAVAAAPEPVAAASRAAPAAVPRDTVPGSRERAGGDIPRPPADGKKQSHVAPVPPVVPPAGDPYLGTTLNGRFTVEKKLGEGGFGAVYNGVQLQTGRKVAIKLLHPEMTRDQNVVARFRREGQVLCSLRDAHTITTYDFDQTADGTLFIAMELLQGRSLHDIFHDEAPIAWQRMLKVMSEMCSSLEEAHTLGIVHRDLKPENVYLEARPGNPEFVKILDFGIAKVMRGDGSSGIAGDMSPQLTATGQTLGTLEYMSPEQLMGKALDGRSDIYGLGVLAFELLTGRLPFPDAVGPAALISAQLKKVPPTASKVNPGGAIPPRVDQLLLKMLAKDKNQRFRDVGELRREIDSILAAGGASPESAGRPSSAAPTQPAPPVSTSPAAPPRATPPPSLSTTLPSPPAPARAPASALHAEQSLRGSSPPARPSPGVAAVTPGPLAPATVASPDAITARSLPRPSPGRGPGPGQGQADPPWAGARPAGSAVSPGIEPVASAGAAGPPVPRPRAPAGAGPTPLPWMWIAVAAALFLAVVIGGLLALR